MPFGFIPIDYGYFQAILAQRKKGYAKDSHLGIPFNSLCNPANIISWDSILISTE